MKRIIYSLVAIVSMLAVSCVQEDTSVTQPIGSEALVSISVGNGSASRAIADGDDTNELLYAVYDADWKLLFTRDVELTTLTHKVEEKLLTGYTYNFVFWAQKEGTYTPEWGTVGQVSVPTVTIDYTNVAANDDSRDAFFGQVEVAVEGTTNKSVELKRPFAQINHGTNDLAKAATAGFNTTALTTSLKVSAYNTLYLNGGGVDGLADVTFVAAARDTDMDKLNTDYDWISMNYVLWTAEESSLGECTLTMTDGVKTIGVKYPQAPARRNYRTNLLGALLTDSANVNVEVKPGTEGDNNVNVPEYENVSNASELQQAIDEGKEHIILTDDIDLNDLLSLFSRATTDTDPKLVINKGNTFTIDLNSKKLSATSSLTTNPREMFLVKGNLTVVNGTIEYKHIGENMEWNGMTTIFDITDGGVLNLDGVVAKNLGGTDMTFVAHLNNWGEVTLNVDNSTLEAPYIAVRAFNSGYDMNNITIKNSTLKGKYCFWVHNYKAAGDAVGTDETLNLDILDGTNTFIPNEGRAPILYGFANPIYYDANGNEWVADGASKDAEGNYLIYNAAGLEWFADNVNTMEFYVSSAVNIFDGKTVYLTSDIDLGGAEWTPIGDYAFSRTIFRGVFDGQNHTISNFTVGATSRTEDVDKCPYGLFGNVTGTIKNLKVDNATVAPEGGRFAGVLVGRLKEGALVDNCHITNSQVTINHWQVGGIVGQANDADIKNSSISSSTITGYAGVGAIAGFVMVAGDYTVENCEVKNCAIEQNGSFGESYDVMFGLVAGYGNNAGVNLYINNFKAENNTIKGVASETLVGGNEGKTYLNGSILVSTAAELESALKAGGEVSLANDIALTKWIPISNANFTINGNGHAISQAPEFATSTHNNISLFDITYGKVALKNIVFDGIQKCAIIRTVYAESSFENVTAKNCAHTVSQGMIRLVGTAAFENCTFKDNSCETLVTFGFDDAPADASLAVENCVFENNTCSGIGVVYYAGGSCATITNNKFVGNITNTTANGATVYVGFTENNVITGNLFQSNQFNTTGTSKRIAGGLMLGYEAVFTGNAFIGNTISAPNSQGKGNDVCASAYYCDIDLSGNYWGGTAPVENVNYYNEYPSKYSIIVNDYLTENPIK